MKRPPDLILSDVKMPRLDGFSLLKALRADPRTSGLPVIMLSARAGEESRVEGMEAGADDYLVKPFSARELLARVSAHLQMARMRRAASESLRESEEQYRALVRASSDVVYRMSADWTEMRHLDGRTFIADTHEPSRSWLEKYATARIRAEEALREADRLKDEFLATLAHELRNPLAPLLNGLQLMRLAKNDGQAVEQAQTMMERQLRQMVRLIDDLMDLTCISRGKVILQKARIPLAVAVGNAVETSRPLIERAGHDMTLEMPDEPIVVNADETRLSQVFVNLLNNAAKYTDAGGRIRLTVERQGADAVVTVADNGMGIPALMLSRVFDMFTQVDSSLEKSRGGLGIGLSIVKRLVEMHGGSIEACSDGPGRGSRFVVRLPVVVSLAPDEPAADSEGRSTPAARRRILVADDSRDAAMSLALLLKITGNETRTAHDGLEALEVAAEFQPDVILLDIGMPKLNGHDAVRRIREQPWGRNIVLVALTGWGQEEDRRRSKHAGFNFHLVKPVELGALEQLLGSWNSATH